jgi:hypothetical protein
MKQTSFEKMKISLLFSIVLIFGVIHFTSCEVKSKPLSRKLKDSLIDVQIGDININIGSGQAGDNQGNTEYGILVF